MTYAFYTTQGQAASLNIPVEIDTTGYTLSVEFAKSSSFRTINTTKTGTAAGKSVTLSLTAGEVNTIGTGYFRIKGTKTGVTTILQDGSVTILLGGPTGDLVKTVQDRVREDFPGAALNSDFWEVVQTGSGQTIAVTSSELRVTTGTTANAQTVIRSKRAWSGAYRVMFVSAAALLSQRIANQEFELRVTNAAGTSYAGWVFSGTTATTQLARAANNSNQLSDVSVANSQSTATAGMFELENFIDEIYYHSRASDSVNGRVTSTVRNRQTPDPTEPMFVEIRVKNLATAPASSTTLSLDAVLVQDISELTTEITGGRGGGGASQAIPVTPAGGSMVVNANASNVSPVLILTASDPITATNLTAGNTYTQTGVDLSTNVNNRPTRHRVTVMHLAGVAPGRLSLQESADNTTWRETWASPIPSDGLYHTFDVPNHLRYYRWVFVNGATGQTGFWLSDLAIRGDGAADIDKNLTIPLTPAAGQASAISATTTFPALDLGANHLWDKVRTVVSADQTGNTYCRQSMDGSNWISVPALNGVTQALAADIFNSNVREYPIVGRYISITHINGTTAANIKAFASLASL